MGKMLPRARLELGLLLWQARMLVTETSSFVRPYMSHIQGSDMKQVLLAMVAGTTNEERGTSNTMKSPHTRRMITPHTAIMLVKETRLNALSLLEH